MSTVYFIINGYEVFPGIIGGEDVWDEKVRSPFALGLFPGGLLYLQCHHAECWEREYSSACEVLEDVRLVEKACQLDQYRGLRRVKNNTHQLQHGVAWA